MSNAIPSKQGMDKAIAESDICPRCRCLPCECQPEPRCHHNRIGFTDAGKPEDLDIKGRCYECGAAIETHDGGITWSRRAMTTEVAEMAQKPRTTFRSDEVPANVLAAVAIIHEWFQERGNKTWTCGPICSRDYAHKLKRITEILHTQ